MSFEPTVHLKKMYTRNLLFTTLNRDDVNILPRIPMGTKFD